MNSRGFLRQFTKLTEEQRLQNPKPIYKPYCCRSLHRERCTVNARTEHCVYAAGGTATSPRLRGGMGNPGQAAMPSGPLRAASPHTACCEQEPGTRSAQADRLRSVLVPPQRSELRAPLCACARRSSRSPRGTPGSDVIPGPGDRYRGNVEARARGEGQGGPGSVTSRHGVAPRGPGWRWGLAASARALLRVFTALSGVRSWLCRALCRALCRLKAAVLPRASQSRELSRTPGSPQLPVPAEASWRLVRLFCRVSSRTRP